MTRLARSRETTLPDRRPIDRGVSVSWRTPTNPLEVLALECMRYLRSETEIAKQLEGCDYLIMIEQRDVIAGGTRCGSMVTLPSLQGKGFEETHALAKVLSMHMNAIRQFLQEAPGMKPHILELLRGMTTDA